MMARFCVVLVGVIAALGLVAGSPLAAAAGNTCPAVNLPDELVVMGGSGQTAQLGHPFGNPLQVALANSNGCPLTGHLAAVNVDFYAPSSGASGTFASTGTTVAVVGTDAQGVATAPSFTANDTAGSYTVDAKSDDGTVELDLTNTATGVPAAIAAGEGSGQQATVGSEYAELLQARVTDANGDPVQGAVVSFSILPGATGAGAQLLGGEQATTDSNGIATSPPLLANASPGRFAAVATVDGVSAIATYSLDNHAAITTVTALVRSDPSASVGGSYVPLQARVLDANGQPLEGAAVTFSISPSAGGAGAAFVGGGGEANELTNANGVATSPALVANTTAGTFTATAGSGGTSDPAGYTLRNRAAAPASIIAGAASGESTGTGHRFAVPLAVTVADRYGNPVTDAEVMFQAPARGASGRFDAGRHHRRALRVVSIQTNAHGIAIAPPFVANSRPGGYVVMATVRGRSARAAFALVNLAHP
jgi:protocatechuate 3,4-dioxygenase beta subunit